MTLHIWYHSAYLIPCSIYISACICIYFCSHFNLSHTAPTLPHPLFPPPTQELRAHLAGFERLYERFLNKRRVGNGIAWDKIQRLQEGAVSVRRCVHSPLLHWAHSPCQHVQWILSTLVTFMTNKKMRQSYIVSAEHAFKLAQLVKSYKLGYQCIMSSYIGKQYIVNVCFGSDIKYGSFALLHTQWTCRYIPMRPSLNPMKVWPRSS